MKPTQAVVAGHICLDIIPAFDGRAATDFRSLLAPGALVKIGPAVFSTGGAVSNTGLALHRLGIPARLMGKVGDDLVGRMILDVLRSHSPALAEGMIVAAGEHSSYTIVINPPGVDRTFLHCTGANDTFGAGDIDCEKLTGARLFHFGYPPLMRRMFSDGGAELEAILREARKRGAATSLDMSVPDPASEAGKVDWAAYLRRVLPLVDIYLPSFEETLFMIDRRRFDASAAADGELLGELAKRLLGWGAKIVVLKLGDQGAYMRTGDDAGRIASAVGPAPASESSWAGREMLAPCFQVSVAGTTGCGDCTIAGFLAGLLHGLSPEECLTAGVAVGACSVEKADTVSGIGSWDQTLRRIKSGWARRDLRIPLPGWKWNDQTQVRLSPADAANR